MDQHETINQSGSSRSSIVLSIVSFPFYLLTALVSSKLKDLPKNIERTISAVETKPGTEQRKYRVCRKRKGSSEDSSRDWLEDVFRCSLLLGRLYVDSYCHSNADLRSTCEAVPSRNIHTGMLSSLDPLYHRPVPAITHVVFLFHQSFFLCADEVNFTQSASSHHAHTLDPFN
jgi:hypothetical protein